MGEIVLGIGGINSDRSNLNSSKIRNGRISFEDKLQNLGLPAL